MNVPFELNPLGPITPTQGEELGADLKAAGDAVLARLSPEASATGARFVGYRAATLYSLAADAYERGAGASIGHNRRDRYSVAARELRQRAAELLEA